MRHVEPPGEFGLADRLTVPELVQPDLPPGSRRAGRRAAQQAAGRDDDGVAESENLVRAIRSILPHRVRSPRHTHQLDDGGLGGEGEEPGNLVIEGSGVPGTVAGPWHRGDDPAVIRTGDAWGHRSR
jgi:hypothetical protein